MSLHLHDTATRTIREFRSRGDSVASIYLCGATVQGIPHIGHVRSGLNFDVLRRWLQRNGYDVRLVRNVTDIDDKILVKSAEAEAAWWAWSLRFERDFQDTLATLGTLRPDYEPRATGHITEIIEYMQRIIDNGHGYAADGNVYATPATIEGYGELSGQRIDELDQGESQGTGKRDPRDFTLWKAAKPGEPSWPTPWGRGRPGWHIECTAMSTKYLGSEFDIHCGGLDLKFPHHENEIAQATAAGDKFARYWMHNGWVTMSGEKMSKSLGNVLSVPNVVELVRPVELRYYLGSAHYRSMLEYSEGALHEAAVGYRRIEDFVNSQGPVTPGTLPEQFVNALDDDLGVPAALAVVHTTVREGNAHPEKAAELAGQVRAMTAILGVDPQSETWASANSDSSDALAKLVEVQIQQRQKAREEKDWATADAVRDTLAAAGIELKDGADGTTWKVVNG